MTIREQLIAEIKDCRYHADCMSLLVKRYRNYDKYINTFLAITSSGSIAGWVIWSEWAFIWSFLIALSQLINALRPLYPFQKHVHTINTRCYKEELYFMELIELLNNLDDNNEEEKNIKRNLNYLKRQINENEFFDDEDGFEFDDKIQTNAAKLTADTLRIKYNIE